MSPAVDNSGDKLIGVLRVGVLSASAARGRRVLTDTPEALTCTKNNPVLGYTTGRKKASAPGPSHKVEGPGAEANLRLS